MTDSKIGTISVDSASLVVQFRYNTECFRVISKLHGVRYDKEKKVWTVPLVRASEVLRLKTFARNKFNYNFDEQSLAQSLAAYEQRIAAARERALKNPFHVSRDDIDLLSFDVVLDLSGDARWIVCKVSRARKAKKIIKELPSVWFSKKERGFVTSSIAIHSLLKLFRDQEVSFAVAAELSDILKSSAEIRAAIARGLPGGSATVLQKSLLSPVVEYVHQKGVYVLDGAPTEVRSRLRISSKKQHIELGAESVITLLYRAKQQETPLFLTGDAYEALSITRRELEYEFSQSADRFRDELLAFVSLPVCWRVEANGIGILEVAKEYWQQGWTKKISEVVKELGVVKLCGETIRLRATPLKAVEFFDAVTSLAAEYDECIPVSRDFRAYLALIRERGQMLAQQLSYQQLSDFDLRLQEDAHARRLYPHQRVAVSWLLEFESGMLGDDMGLGKTLSVLTAFQELKDRAQCDLLLVICPNSLVKNWIRESAQWFPKLAAAKLPDTKKERTQFLAAFQEQRITSIDAMAINFESMRLEDVWPALKSLCESRRVFLCIDESQRMKNPQSKTFAALKEFAFLAQRRVLLSGTPTPKDITDIWAQMYIIDKGERFGRSYYQWLGEVAELGTKWSEYAVKKFKPHAVEDAIARVHEVLLRRKKEDVISLPEKIFLFRDVALTGEQKKRFDDLREDLKLHVRNAAGKASVKVIESLLEQYLRAVQMASNPRLIDPLWKGEPAKFLELDDIVSDVVKDQGEKLVIWTNYLGNINELVKRYEAYGARPFSGEVSADDRSATIARFQDPADKTRILVAIPAAGGVGITLTAAQTAVYIDRTWNAEHWLQSIDRIHRIGQKGAVRIIVLNASKIDELIGFNLKRKGEAMEKLLSGHAGYEALLPTIDELLQSLE